MHSMPGRSHASIACRYQKIQNKADPSRKKIAQKGTAKCKHSKRRSDAMRSNKLYGVAATTSNGIYVSVKNLVDRSISAIMQRVKHYDYQRTNLRCVIGHKIRRRIQTYLKKHDFGSYEVTRDSVKLTPAALIDYLKAMLVDGENLLDMEVDHIFPVSKYDLSDPAELSKCQHFSNLQPLTFEENRHKAAKLPTKSMALLVHKDVWPKGVTEDVLPDCYDGWRSPLRK